MKNIAVIFGGKTVEHDISIITGLQVISNLKEKYNVIPIYISREGVWLTGQKLLNLNSYTNFCKTSLKTCYVKPNSKFLYIKGVITKERKIDSVILALHGAHGEDGTIQGLLELTQIPYVSSGVLGSAITMDKAILKMLLERNDIKTPKFLFFYEDEYKNNEAKILDKIKKELGKKVVVKPDRAGSSIGVKVCLSAKEIKEAIELSFCFDNKIIVEECVSDFREINIACLGNRKDVYLSKLEEVVSAGQILSFDEKYINSENTQRIVDVKLEKDVEETIKEYAKKAFYICEMNGVCRMDFFVTQDGVMLNEINSIPGSMANYLFDMSFLQLLEKLIEISCKKIEEREKLIYLYKSDALVNFEKANSKMKK